MVLAQHPYMLPYDRYIIESELHAHVTFCRHQTVLCTRNVVVARKSVREGHLELVVLARVRSKNIRAWQIYERGDGAQMRLQHVLHVSTPDVIDSLYEYLHYSATELDRAEPVSCARWHATFLPISCTWNQELGDCTPAWNMHALSDMPSVLLH